MFFMFILTCCFHSYKVFGGLLFEVKSKDQPLMFSQEEGTSEGDEAGDETNDLKEHVVGILFSNSTNLSSLQKQVRIARLQINYYDLRVFSLRIDVGLYMCKLEFF